MLNDSSYNISMLLKQVSEDNEQAFRMVFDHYKNPFYATAFKMTRSAEIAEEVVQEVFVAVWMKRDLIGKANNPEGYVFTILHNCIYSHFRKQVLERKLKAEMTQVEEPAENHIEILLLEKENKAILEDIISRLPPQQKLIYKLAKQEGISREDIAKQLNISPNTVRNHLSSAVGYLRTYIKKNESEVIWAFILMSL